MRVPPLENGDHLTSAEFERRYWAMPHVNKAQLIEGVVYMPSPVNHQRHGLPHSAVMGVITVYAAGTPGVLPGDNSTVRLDDDNQPQPDALLFLEPGRPGARVRLDDGIIAGTPEFVAEVASSSVSIDRNAKLRAYQRNGVREYLLWRVDDEEVDYFVLRDGAFVPLTPDGGLYRSAVFPGLWFRPAALVALDLAACLATAQQGLASPEHAAFAASLG